MNMCVVHANFDMKLELIASILTSTVDLSHDAHTISHSNTQVFCVPTL